MESFKSYIYSFLMFGFLLVLFVDGNSNQQNQRSAAAQGVYEKMTLAQGNPLKSALFASCLTPAREIEAKLFSLGVPSTAQEFVRHVPGASLGVPFQGLVTSAPLGNIFACASAAYASGYKMFRFMGPGNCTASRYAYDLSAAPTCTEEEIDAVFVLSSANVSLPCQPPRLYAGSQPDGVTTNCIDFGTTITGSVFGASLECGKKGMSTFHPRPGTSVDDVAAILKRLGRTEKFRVGIEYKAFYAWMWTNNATLKANESKPGLDLSSNQGGSVDIMFLDPAYGYLVNLGSSTASFVTLCITSVSG